MPKAAIATNKTEFQRYLNDFPESVPSLASLHRRYQATPHKRSGNGLFGFWLRRMAPNKFAATYTRFWLTRPDLHGKVYENVVQEFAGTQPSYHQQF
jgi:hypothetical protein